MSSLPTHNATWSSETNNSDWCGILYVAITNSDQDFIELYEKHVESYNKNSLSTRYVNAGFDLLVPKDVTLEGGNVNAKMVSMEVKCEMRTMDGKPLSYYMYPRSSISKTPLILANHVGIIDSGYRGELIGAFRNLAGTDTSYTIQKHTRILQVCHPELKPIYVRLVDESELSNTERGSGGFGSTGK